MNNEGLLKYMKSAVNHQDLWKAIDNLEQDEHNQQESAQTIKLKELIARKAVDLFLSNGLYYDKNLVLVSESSYEDNKLFNFYSKQNDAYFRVTVTPKNTISVRAYGFVEHREWKFNPNDAR